MKIGDTLPFKHKAGKMVASTLVGFIASELAERAYDAVLKAYRKKMASRKEV